LVSTTRPQTSSLMIVFRRDASTSQEAVVRRQLAADSRVASFTFRAANDGYAITGSEFPASTAVVSRGATAPSTITIRLTSGADAAAFVGQYERQPGVAVVDHDERLPGETVVAAAP